jgi:4-hydroxy-tetrahydrodipicolinate synthase
MVDEQAFRDLVERQIAAGIHGLVPAGSTGESATLTMDEHMHVMSMCVEAAKGRVPVVAGAGANATHEAIALARHARAIGAEAALIVAPYYNRPSQEGLFAHFEAIDQEAKVPFVVYNVPGRTGVDIAPETMARIARLPHAIGLKDSAGDPARTQRHRALCPSTFHIWCGDDPLALGFAAYGATACVSVASNVAPAECAQLQTLLLAGDYAGARTLNDRLAGLYRALFLEPNPTPSKYALARLGLCAEDVRLPLTPPLPPTRASIDAALAALGFLKD